MNFDVNNLNIRTTCNHPLQLRLQSSREPCANRVSTKQVRMQCNVLPNISAEHKDDIDKKLLYLFTKDLQAFSVLSDEGFKDFVQALNPLYELPSRYIISKTLIPAMYEECLNNTKAIIQKAKTFCITTDAWTSRNTTSFIGVTAHFVDNEFNLKSVLLDCCVAPEVRHTASNLASTLKYIMNSWQINAILAISDNAANIKKAIETELKCKRFGCFAHTINLIVQHALEYEPIQIILNKIRDICSFLL